MKANCTLALREGGGTTGSSGEDGGDGVTRGSGVSERARFIRKAKEEMTYAANFHRRDLVFLMLLAVNFIVFLCTVAGLADTRLLIISTLAPFGWAVRYGAEDLIALLGFNVFCAMYNDLVLSGGLAGPLPYPSASEL